MIQVEVYWHPCPVCGHMAVPSKTGGIFGRSTWNCTNKSCQWTGDKPTEMRGERRDWAKRAAPPSPPEK